MDFIKTSYLLRILGILTIIPMFFKFQLMNVFPILEIYPQFSNILFGIGISLFILGALVYSIGSKKKR